jgi:3-isopropylmalate/(R)-2-methylmalate dehydratase small subunit
MPAHPKITGRVWKFGDNVNTDQIIPSKYCNTFDPESLGPHAMEGADPEFARRAAPGDFILGGHNFGCGSSREAAPIAIKALGITGVVAHSFARLFFRNAVNVGLHVFVSPSASQGIEQGDEIEIDASAGIISSRTTGRVYSCKRFGGIVQEIIDAGGMAGYVRERLGLEHHRQR